MKAGGESGRPVGKAGTVRRAKLLYGDCAAVVGSNDDWAKVDLSLCSTGMDSVGRIPASTLNSSGPGDDLRAVEL